MGPASTCNFADKFWSLISNVKMKPHSMKRWVHFSSHFYFDKLKCFICTNSNLDCSFLCSWMHLCWIFSKLLIKCVWNKGESKDHIWKGTIMLTVYQEPNYMTALKGNTKLPIISGELAKKPDATKKKYPLLFSILGSHGCRWKTIC